MTGSFPFDTALKVIDGSDWKSPPSPESLLAAGVAGVIWKATEIFAARGPIQTT